MRFTGGNALAEIIAAATKPKRPQPLHKTKGLRA
jgi:hypothetical protein